MTQDEAIQYIATGIVGYCTVTKMREQCNEEALLLIPKEPESNGKDKYQYLIEFQLWQKRWYNLAQSMLAARLENIVAPIVPDWKYIAKLVPDTAREYFINHGWHTVPEKYYATFNLAGWIVEKPTGFEHCSGAYVNIDWLTKSQTVCSYGD